MTDVPTPDFSRKIFVHDDLHPEDGAMLQALYSRSPASVETHLAKVREVGSGKFMSQYYVGYGHASIGDCGVTTVFMENYSMLAAKAIQDNPLYSGQEASTRYLDFAQQPMHDPYNHPASKAIQDGWMALYNATMPKVKAALAEKYPFDPAQYKTEKIWQNTLAARAFDILRGFLPVGCTTLFSWTTNLRQARDRVMQLKHHPLPELRQLARDLFVQLREKYPNSFTGEEMEEGGRYEARDAYLRHMALRDNFVSLDDLLREQRIGVEHVRHMAVNGNMIVDKSELRIAHLRAFERDALEKRAPGAALHRRLQSYGQYNLYFILDFGSFRDIQRHRNGVCQIPFIDGRFGIYGWYIQQLRELLPEAESIAFEKEAGRLMRAIHTLGEQGVDVKPELSQYLFPMGTAIVCQLAYSLPQMVYVAELRSQKTVHPSLRPVAQEMGRVLREDFPNMALFVDFDVDTWSAKRGEQTIEAKGKAA